jgi:hypothetical protein
MDARLFPQVLSRPQIAHGFDPKMPRSNTQSGAHRYYRGLSSVLLRSDVGLTIADKVPRSAAVHVVSGMLMVAC